MQIVCVGDCGVDLYRPSGARHFGGITANFARHARHEFPADDIIRIVSCIGDDDGGALVLDSLQDSGIDCNIARIAGRTPVQTIEVRPDGERHFVHYDAGVLQDFRFSESQRAMIATADFLVAPVYLQIVGLFDELMSIRPAGRSAIDFADFLQHPDFSLLDRHIGRIDVGFFGLTADDRRTIDAIAERAARHDRLFVVTLGAAGSLALGRGARITVPAVPVADVVDTTGAGDAFAAGFLSRWCHGSDIQSALEHGARVASRVVGRVGTHP